MRRVAVPPPRGFPSSFSPKASCLPIEIPDGNHSEGNIAPSNRVRRHVAHGSPSKKFDGGRRARNRRSSSVTASAMPRPLHEPAGRGGDCTAAPRQAEHRPVSQDPSSVRNVDVTGTPITLDNLETLRDLMYPREIWRNFGYRTPPSLFGLKLAWRSGGAHGIYFVRQDTGRIFGFALGFGQAGPDSELEFAIAVTEKVERGL